jgi:Histidine kinase-, DNA gyrase B-, and HSP90-like ATPase
VWTNLIDNAIDAMEAAGTLRLTAQAEGDDVVVEVADSGHNMPKEVAARAFEPFYTTRAVGKGAGLGLDIAQRVVNVLGVSRLITNPALALREPMNFDRPDPADFSLVEQAVLRALGVERVAFAPTAPRESVVPDRVRRQQAREVEESARLADAKRAT